jgi:hypothetical protein
MLVFAACGGDGGSGPDSGVPEALIGQWVANEGCLPEGCAFTVYAVASPADSINIVSASVSLSMLVQSTGRVILTIPGFASGEGTARVSGSRMYIDGEQKTDTVDFSVNGDVLNLNFVSHFNHFDVDGDEVADLARVRAVFVRTP